MLFWDKFNQMIIGSLPVYHVEKPHVFTLYCIVMFHTFFTGFKRDYCTRGAGRMPILSDFPGGAPTLPGGGGATHDFAKFSRKRHEIERIWASLLPPWTRQCLHWIFPIVWCNNFLQWLRFLLKIGKVPTFPKLSRKRPTPPPPRNEN